MVSAKENAGLADGVVAGFLSFEAGVVAFAEVFVVVDAVEVVVGFLLAALKDAKSVDGLLMTWVPRGLAGAGTTFSPGRFCCDVAAVALLVVDVSRRG